MAKLVRSLRGDFDEQVDTITRRILDASHTASLEECWDVKTPQARCSVRVFERYSYTGSNRVSMNVTFFKSGSDARICAITSGGSQAMFFKINTMGEEAFLDTLRDILDDLG